jgi:hypothetical protein
MLSKATLEAQIQIDKTNNIKWQMNRILLSLIVFFISPLCYSKTDEPHSLIWKQRHSIQYSHLSINVFDTPSPSDTITLTNFAPFESSDSELIRLFNVQANDPDIIGFTPEGLEHVAEFSINRKQFFTRGSDTYMLAVLGASLPWGVHFDSGPSFIGCFRLENGHWVSQVKALEVHGHSMWGNCDEVLQIEKYGPNHICVSLQSTQGNHGYMLTSVRYFGLTDTNEFQLIFEGKSSENDGGAGGNLDDRYEYEFIRQPIVTYYTLEMKRFSHENLKQRRLIQFNQEKGKYELN